MTSKELLQYRSIVTEIDEIRDRLSKNTVHDVVVGSDSEFPYVKHSFSVGGALETKNNKRDMILLRELEVRKKAIEEFIENISDSELRRIFKYRYINGKIKPTWQGIAFKIGGWNSADNVRMRHSRYLNKQKNT